MKFIKNIFSINNSGNYKILTFLGLKLKIYSLKLHLRNISIMQEDMQNKIMQLQPFIRFASLKPFQIDKGLIDIKLEKYAKKAGISAWVEVNRDKRTPEIIVSLTSFPERMTDIHYALFSLLNQTLKPDRIILWLALEQFPNKEEDIPDKVLQLKNFGLEILYTNDIKSYKKLIPSLKNYPDSIIVTADDDIYYPENWLELLYSSYIEAPNYIHAHRVHKIAIQNNKIAPYSNWQHTIDDNSISYINFPTTGAGVLYPPKALHADTIREELFMKLSPFADDIWFWAMAVLNNKKIKVIKNPIKQILSVNIERHIWGKSLYNENMILDNKQDKQLNAVLEYYPELQKLMAEL